jgi:hypothetical protein
MVVLQPIGNNRHSGDAPKPGKEAASSIVPTADDMTSRTAALSRYLAALDSPADNNPSVAMAPELNAPVAVTTAKSDEFETTFGNAISTDLFSGHKVVAMPSPGGNSVREIVSSREPASGGNRRTGTPTGSRPRSRSAGRAPQSTARDIVQEAYDRMGVSREDLTGDADKFQARYRAAAALSASGTDQPALAATSPTHTQRGRVMDFSPDGQRRARSLSRGRKLTSRWPPAREEDKQDKRESRRESAPEKPAAATPTDLRVETALPTPPSILRQGMPQQSEQRPETPVEESIRINRSSSFPSSPNRLKLKMQRKSVPPPPPPPEPQSQPAPLAEEAEESISAVSSDTGLSVKDRITAISGGKDKSNRNFPKRALPVPYTKQARPPKIDIYEEIRKKDEDEPSRRAPEPSNFPPSPVAAAAADAAAELVRKNQYGRPRTTPSSSNDKSDSFLSPTNSKPPIEIAGADESGGVTDTGSVALSSVSADEFPDRSPLRITAKKENLTKRWNGVTARSTVQTPPITPNYSTSSDQIERLVEERVHVQLEELETRMGAQMLRLERQMEERMKNRMDKLENKMDKIGSMLSLLLSNRQEI